ncbi:MAG: hypothetical protein PHW87_00560 [Methanothrix sp.]|nr:hypothetical protein [Methanothrix sp.]
MCWDAVGYCGYLAGLTSSENGGGKNIITSAADIVNSSNNITIGHIIGFFENGDLKHAMISLGSGEAAGNKNDCMGFGHSVGWEKINLPEVNREDGTFIPNGQTRTIVMRHKSF